MWGKACLSFLPTTSSYGAFEGATLEVTATPTTTETYQGRVARQEDLHRHRVLDELPGDRELDLLLLPAPADRLRRPVSELTAAVLPFGGVRATR